MLDGDGKTIGKIEEIFLVEETGRPESSTRTKQQGGKAGEPAEKAADKAGRVSRAHLTRTGAPRRRRDNAQP